MGLVASGSFHSDDPAILKAAFNLSDGNSKEGTWGRADMDRLDASLRAMLAASGVPAEDQSSILHLLASDIDAVACADGSAN